MQTSFEQCPTYLSMLNDTNAVVKFLENPTRYSPTVSPAPRLDNIMLKVVVAVNIYKLLDLSTEKILDTLLKVTMAWIDPNIKCLQCDQQILVPASLVWTPVLGLQGPATRTWQYDVTIDPILTCQCQKDAPCGGPGMNVYVDVTEEFATVCGSMDVTLFPFDVQTCQITLFSLYANDLVEFAPMDSSTSVAISEFASSNDWLIQNATLSTLTTGTLSTFTITVVLRRESFYYVMTLLAPTMVLGSLQPLVFMVPSDEGVKVLISATLLLALNVLQGSVTQQLPPFDETTVPNIVTALLAASILSFASLIEAVLFQTIRIWAHGLPKVVNNFVVKLFVPCCCEKQQPKSVDGAYETSVVVAEDFSTPVGELRNGRLSYVEVLLLRLLTEQSEREKVRLAEKEKARLQKKQKKLIRRAWKRFENCCNMVSTAVAIAVTVYYFGVIVQL